MIKSSFVLQTRFKAVVAKLSDKQAGVLLKSILDYADSGTVANFDDGMVAVVFEMVRQDIDYNSAKYADVCARNAENGKLGGAPKGNQNAKKQPKQPTACFNNPKQPKTTENKHNDNDNDVDNDNDIKNILTAPKVAGKVSLSKPKRPLNGLQEFSNKVIEQFEQEVKTPEQKRIWFKRNCRNLTDILKYCGGDQVLALGCIAACASRLEKAGLSGGYEAVCRNLPDYFAQAKKLQEVAV